ncbi:ParB/RepB/Spo0J family partition protein [Nocardioides sp. Leaf285]|uniref:ParB/RepB/Spo0J family partition protein n=1 Tax=Nocardioides sp. Leaf285 TaxID=1736322 RepID=UPI000B16F497|nr:ParB/RepB/Spo0J family partition protein [Nocardioides sp. Leaf285]
MSRTTAAVIALDDLLASPHNVRPRLTNLGPLAASIRSVGVLQTLLVVPAPRGKFRIIEGHRRRAASVMAGKTHVPCMVRHENATDEIGLMAIANLQREGLDPIDVARAFSDLRERHTVAQIAAMTGFSAATINARIGLLLLPPEAQEMVSDQRLSLGDAAQMVQSLKKTGSGKARIGAGRRSVSHFKETHRLAGHVKARCTHRDSDRRLMGPGCGQCWEETIRADALGHLDNVSVLQPPTVRTAPRPEGREVDQALVERVVNGGPETASLGIGERQEAVRMLAARGLSDPQIATKINASARTVLRIRQRLDIAPAIPASSASPRPTSGMDLDGAIG